MCINYKSVKFISSHKYFTNILNAGVLYVLHLILNQFN